MLQSVCGSIARTGSESVSLLALFYLNLGAGIMRFLIVSTISLALAALAGCTSTTSIESIMAQPSPETTGSIMRPLPPAPLVTADAETLEVKQTKQEILAWAGPIPEAPQPQTALNAPKPEMRPVQQAALHVPRPQTAPSSKTSRATLTRPKVYTQRFRDAKPINFGRSSPKKHAVHGVDVSRWQGNIDWHTLRKQGANFAYIKATDGGDHLDPMFHKNWRRAKEAGIKRGAYHFFYWCRVASEQADWFIRNVPKDPDALPPVIDVEWNGDSACKRRPSRAVVLEKMQVFMDKLERHYGKRPIIYTAPDFYADNLKGAFKDYPFWLRAVAQHPSKVYPGRPWVFWQYSGSGLSQGVNEKIDLNVFHGTEKEWHAWLQKHAT